MISTAEGFAECERIARTHYENFPVASFFLPKDIRPHVAAIYAFARTADDFADEGEHPAAWRLNALDDWGRQLDACYDGRAETPVFVALCETVRVKQIPKQLLADLLTAFRMDVTTQRHRTFDDLLHYCRHSANPVGRLVLYLFGDADEEKCRLSDDICTALQLANFWQDIALDLRKDRVYLPLEEIERFGYTEQRLFGKHLDSSFVELLRFQVERTRKYFNSGKPLVDIVVPKLRFELALTWLGGVTILKKIERAGYDVLSKRPAIGGADKFAILLKAITRQVR